MADHKGRSVTIKFPCTLTLSEVRNAIKKEHEGATLTVIQDLGAGEFLIKFANKSHAEEFINSGLNFIGLRAYIEDEKVIPGLPEFGEIKSDVIRLKYKVVHELAALENGNLFV